MADGAPFTAAIDNTPTIGDKKSQKEILKSIVRKFIDNQPSQSPRNQSDKVDYKNMVELLHPVAMEYRKRVGLETIPDEPIPTGLISPASSMVISLSDELEWQESSRTHSPRTPTAPEALRALKRTTPPQTPPRRNVSPEMITRNSPEPRQLSENAALEMLANPNNIRASVIRGDLLCFPDGTSLPVGLILPLHVCIVERSNESKQESVTISDEPVGLSVGSAWLSIMAERTYESQLASLLRARKGLVEICIQDRIQLNRFLRGDITLEDLKKTRLWVGSDRVSSQVEEVIDGNDYLSSRLKQQNQLSSLEEKKTMLQDQQTRLRRLMARELQRLHSSRPTIPSATSQDVQGAVANLLKRFKPAPKSSKELNPSEGSATPTPDVTMAGPAVGPKLPQHQTREMLALRMRLKALKIEWCRVGDKLRIVREDETSLERRIKRLRYVDMHEFQIISVTQT
jgi:hypothetical protein